jgi:hypothetical protein
MDIASMRWWLRSTTIWITSLRRYLMALEFQRVQQEIKGHITPEALEKKTNIFVSWKMTRLSLGYILKR